MIKLIDEKTGRRPGPITDESVRALIRASLVFLVAALEVYIEELYKFAVSRRFPDLDEESSKRFLERTVARFNVPSAAKTDELFTYIGIPFITRSIGWQRMSNQTFKKKLQNLIEERGRIAHGEKLDVRLTSLRDYSSFVDKYVEVLEGKVRSHLGI